LWIEIGRRRIRMLGGRRTTFIAFFKRTETKACTDLPEIQQLHQQQQQNLLKNGSANKSFDSEGRRRYMGGLTRDSSS
jgi:hypothetical protein